MEAGLGDIFADSDVKIAKSLCFTEVQTKNSEALWAKMNRNKKLGSLVK